MLLSLGLRPLGLGGGKGRNIVHMSLRRKRCMARQGRLVVLVLGALVASCCRDCRWKIGHLQSRNVLGADICRKEMSKLSVQEMGGRLRYFNLISWWLIDRV